MSGQPGDLQAWLNTLKKRAETQQKGAAPSQPAPAAGGGAKAQSRYTEPFGHRKKPQPIPRTVFEAPASEVPGGGQRRGYERAEDERHREESVRQQEEVQAERVRSTLPDPDVERKEEFKAHRRPAGETEKPRKRSAAQRPPKSATQKRMPVLEQPVMPMGAGLRSELMRELKQGPKALRKAILLQEILQSPLALRQQGQQM